MPPGFGKDSKGQILYQDIEVAVGAVSQSTSKLLDNYDLTEDFRLLKTEIMMMKWSALTAGEGEFATIFLYDGELTEAELTDCITADPTDRNDNAKLEQSHRFNKPIGSMTNHPNDNTRAVLEGYHPGLSIEPRWTFSAPEGWSIGLYTQVAITTGSTFRALLKHFGVWVT